MTQPNEMIKFYANLDPATRVVRQVITVPSVITDGNAVEFITQRLARPGIWVKCSEAGKCFAAVGYIYHPDIQKFSTPSPFPSWTLDPETLEWIAPTPKPETDDIWLWNEVDQAWEIFVEALTEQGDV